MPNPGYGVVYLQMRNGSKFCLFMLGVFKRNTFEFSLKVSFFKRYQTPCMAPLLALSHVASNPSILSFAYSILKCQILFTFKQHLTYWAPVDNRAKQCFGKYQFLLFTRPLQVYDLWCRGYQLCATKCCRLSYKKSAKDISG